MDEVLLNSAKLLLYSFSVLTPICVFYFLFALIHSKFRRPQKEVVRESKSIVQEVPARSVMPSEPSSEPESLIDFISGKPKIKTSFSNKRISD